VLELLGDELYNRAILDFSPVLTKGEASEIIGKFIAKGFRRTTRKK